MLTKINNFLKIINIFSKVIKDIKVSETGDVYVATNGSLILETEGHNIISSKTGNVIVSPRQKIYLAPSRVRDILDNSNRADISKLTESTIEGAITAEHDASKMLFKLASNKLKGEGCCERS